MIVKNEERTIERALSWGKKLMYEQIVVDTGSTDRTVEIAEKLGAKVFHFDWVDDFSKAKNYALSKATGDWIVFLDADEYIHEKDQKKLVEILNDICEYNKNKDFEELVHILRLRIYNMNNTNALVSGGLNDRFFMNHEKIHFRNAIHEVVWRTDDKAPRAVVSEDVSILHDGYTDQAVEAHGKTDRNTDILEEEYRQNPDDLRVCYYLATAYRHTKEKEAIRLLNKVIYAKNYDSVYKSSAILELIEIYASKKNAKKYEDKIVKIYKQHLASKKNNPDIELMVALYFQKIKKNDIAIQFFEAILEMIEIANYDEASRIILANMNVVYRNLYILYKEKKDKAKSIKYLVLDVKLERYNMQVCSYLLKEFCDNNESIDAVYRFLGNLYDFNTFKDRAYMISVAQNVGYEELRDMLYDSLSEEEKQVFDNWKKSKI